MRSIFLIGLPRSGTSWIGKIFDRHPRVLYRFEPDTFERQGAPPYICTDAEATVQLEATRAYLDRVAQVRTLKSAGSLPYFAKAYRSGAYDGLRRAMIYALQMTKRTSLLRTASSRLDIPDLINRGRPEALVIKSIEAVGRVNLYRAAWPESRVVLIVRHPCGQVASLLEGFRSKKFPALDDKRLIEAIATSDQARRRGLTASRLSSMEPIERLAWMWALPNEKAMEDIADDPNARSIRYCDLCATPLSVARDLFEFCGISCESVVEDFIRASTDPEQAASHRYYSVFRNPERTVDRWRSILTADEVAVIRDAVKATEPGRLFEY